MDTIPHTQRPLDESSLFWWKVQDTPPRVEDPDIMQEDTDPLWKWQQFDPELIDCPMTSTHVGDPITKNEVMMMYKCSRSILETLDNFKTMLNHRKGNFPMPGWHKWMIASGFLLDCQRKWGAEAALTKPPKESVYYAEWRELIYLPRPGNMVRGYSELAVSKRVPSLRIVEENDMEEEEDEEMCERPRKLKK